MVGPGCWRATCTRGDGTGCTSSLLSLLFSEPMTCNKPAVGASGKEHGAAELWEDAATSERGRRGAADNACGPAAISEGTDM